MLFNEKRRQNHQSTVNNQQKQPFRLDVMKILDGYRCHRHVETGKSVIWLVVSVNKRHKLGEQLMSIDHWPINLGLKEDIKQIANEKYYYSTDC